MSLSVLFVWIAAFVCSQSGIGFSPRFQTHQLDFSSVRRLPSTIGAFSRHEGFPSANSFPKDAGPVFLFAQDAAHESQEHPDAHNHEAAESLHETGVDHDQHESADHHHGSHHHIHAEGMWKIVSLAGKFHPVMVHFPIVLLLLAALAEVLSIMGIRGFSREAAYFILDLSVIATVITVCLGWAAGAFAEFSEPLNTTMWIHRWLGTGTGILVIISWIASRINRKNSSPTALIVYRTMLLLSASLVVFTGHFGAMLVFGWNHFSV